MKNRNLLTFFFSLLFGFQGLTIQIGFSDSVDSQVTLAPYKLPTPEIDVLPNGLKTVWFLNDAIPVTDIVLVISAGSRDDLKGKSGTAELMSSLLDRGAAGMSAYQIAHSTEMLGASRYSVADDDLITLGMHGLAIDAPVLLDLLSKMSLQPDFIDIEVSRSHARILEKWKHMSDYGESIASLAFHRQLSGGTPYGRGGLLSATEFKNVKRDDVIQFYKKHFVPSRATLMVVGRINKLEFKKGILEKFGTWTGSEPIKEVQNFSDPRLERKKRQIILIDRPGLTQAQVRIGFKAPNLRAPEHYSLAVANALFGEYFNSRLNSIIRDKLGLTYAISSSFTYLKDFATFGVATATRNSSASLLVRKILDLMGDLKSGPITTEEVLTAKEYLIGGFPLGHSTLNAVAARWLSGYLFDLGPQYLNEYIPRISTVSLDQVVRAVGSHFDVENASIVVVGDSKEIVPSFSQLKGYSLKKMKAEEIL